jgi:ABC-type nitrate/sulfonate/bicarbonate transport system ATPase subunit
MSHQDHGAANQQEQAAIAGVEQPDAERQAQAEAERRERLRQRAWAPRDRPEDLVRAVAVRHVGRGGQRPTDRALLDRVGLIDHIDKRADALSGAQLQHVDIARALIREPKLLLVDEPT